MHTRYTAHERPTQPPGPPFREFDPKSTFEESTAGARPLNVGQVYTTLSRLERDGRVVPQGVGEAQAGDPGGAESTRQSWRITDEGHPVGVVRIPGGRGSALAR